MTTERETPPLPEPVMPEYHGDSYFYTADQMRAYGAACAAALLDRLEAAEAKLAKVRACQRYDASTMHLFREAEGRFMLAADVRAAVGDG